MNDLGQRRTTAVVVLCACMASAVVGVLVGQPGGDEFREGQRPVLTRPQTATPIATPSDLPPFFGANRDEHQVGTVVAVLPWIEIDGSVHV